MIYLTQAFRQIVERRTRVTVLILLLAAATACVVEYSDETPQRPESVAADAAWVGGPDGGVWVSLRVDAGQGVYQAKIQHETGTVEYEGRLRLEPAGEWSVDLSLIDAWDGDALLLSDGRVLQTEE